MDVNTVGKSFLKTEFFLPEWWKNPEKDKKSPCWLSRDSEKYFLEEGDNSLYDIYYGVEQIYDRINDCHEYVEQCLDQWSNYEEKGIDDEGDYSDQSFEQSLNKGLGGGVICRAFCGECRYGKGRD